MVSAGTNKQGLLVATDQQLVFLSKEPFSAWKVHQFPYDRIDHLEYTKGIMFGSISIWIDDLEEKFDKLIAYEVERWVRQLGEKIGTS